MLRSLLALAAPHRHGPWMAHLALLTVVLPSVAQAQVFREPDPDYQGIVLQASGAFIFPLGSEFDPPSLSNLDPGPAVAASARWVFPNMISAGAGIRYSWHDNKSFATNAEFLTLFGQIGYTFIFESTPLRPTLGGRIGWTMLSLLPSLDRNGLDVGAFGGVELPLSRTIALSATLTFDFLVLDELPDQPAEGTAQLFGIEAGVVIIP